MQGDRHAQGEAIVADVVELADSLVDDFDVIVLTILTDRCVEVLDFAAAGILLVSPEGELGVMASSNEAILFSSCSFKPSFSVKKAPCLRLLPAWGRAG